MAKQDTDMDTIAHGPARRGIPIRALVPNMITAMALCTGLSGVWFAFGQRWEAAAAAILIAGVLDGMDGRIARMLKGTSRFGAELDSLSDNIAFGVSPALVTFFWSLQHMPKFGWTICLFYALCCALRLARFNAQIDSDDQPHKSAGFLTGVPAPAGAAVALLPLILWLALRELPGGDAYADYLRGYWLVGPWMLIAAVLMISSIATYSASALRVRRHIRFEAIAFTGFIIAAFIAAPWLTLAVVALIYLALIPFSLLSYRKVKQARTAASD